MKKTAYCFGRPQKAIASSALIALLALTAACAPGFTGAQGDSIAAGLPVIQEISVQVLAAESATPPPAATPSGLADNTTPTAVPSPDESGEPPTPDTAGQTDIVIAIEAANFNIVNKAGLDAVPGEGLVHFFLDVVPPVQPGVPAVSAPGTYVAIPDKSYTWPEVSPGLHILSAELVNNDYTPLAAPAVAAVMVWVPADGTASMPQITAISAGFGPSGASPLPGTPSTALPSMAATTASPGENPPGAFDITVSIQPANFSLAEEPGQPSFSGEGHFHYFLDTVPPVFPGMPTVTEEAAYSDAIETTFTWTGVQPGLHLVTAELVNSDHSSFVPPAAAACLLTVMPPDAPPATTITDTTALYRALLLTIRPIQNPF
ncbi:MAG: hypothetical protein PHU23_12450 [Dehalococcoidales bacterium]|nr:hypothetical protein [Dehalococcoidales bacterium]